MKTVRVLLEEIIEQLRYSAPSSGWESIYSNYTKAKRKGKVVTVKGYSAGGGINLPANTYKEITTLPAKYRPSESIYFTVGASGGTAQIIGEIGTNGIVKLHSTQATTYWTFAISYVVE